ncbi:prolyl oligopeptidase family serine peptidase [Eubacteriales bacterium OttesenSCG-928-G02]|nr:prolyl oligopeptidase family serine peptidase [Eubacteriales bacterium OttesenSCG-928-G02]
MIEANDYTDEIRDISAYMWVNENTVPTLCAYGAHDKVCPFDSVRHLITALEENDVPHDYIEFPHSGHGLQNDNALYGEYMEKIDEYLNHYMEE